MIELESPLLKEAYAPGASEDPFEDALEEARLLIEPMGARERIWPTLAAAFFFTICSFIFLGAVIFSPPPRLTPISAVQGPT
jgi:hypothetical protein